MKLMIDLTKADLQLLLDGGVIQLDEHSTPGDSGFGFIETEDNCVEIGMLSE